jgi:hypothetical protein
VAIYKLKTFARFARSEDISDESLGEAIERAARGLVVPISAAASSNSVWRGKGRAAGRLSSDGRHSVG